MDEPPERKQESPGGSVTRTAGTGSPEPHRLSQRLGRALLGADALWAATAVIVLLALTWRPPWGHRFGELLEGRIATSDLVAPIGIDIPDDARTGERIEQARREVDDVYLFDANAAERIGRDIDEALTLGVASAPADPTLAAILREPRGADARAALKRIGVGLLSEKIVARKDTLPHERGITVRYYGAGAEANLRDLSRIIDLEEARRRAREEAARSVPLEPALARAAGEWLAGLLQPTLTFDLPETRRRMDEAGRQVPVLYSRVPRGALIARKGAPLTREAIRAAEAIEAASPRTFDPTSLIGLLSVLGLLVFFLWRFTRDAGKQVGVIRPLFPFLTLVLTLHAALARAGMGLAELVARDLDFPLDRPEILWHLIPSAAGAVVVTLLANNRIATVYGLFATAVIAILFDWNLKYALFVLLTHLAAAYSVRQYRTRSALLRSGLVIGITGAAASAGLDAVSSGFDPWLTCVASALCAFLGGAIGVPLLVAFLLPILEWAFGALTDVRLLELSNLDNPLLSELALRAPGSYNHSVVVGTLAEAAAEAIGANPLFCRVAAYYHDIGKMKMPEYYIENQRPGENPHDRLAPSMSVLILANHVKEGIRLGREHGLPEAILDIIPQHHGTRVMTYFYEKAKSAAAASGSATPREDDFRHPGPKPATKEAAIFMLADSVEAAARTLAEPTKEGFRQLIRQISSRVILDGQFDHCDLTFRDLDEVTEAFVRTLMSIYHHRIDYPTFIFEGAAARRRDRIALGRRDIET